MDLFIYETPDGNVADFRPYLDGFDHSFDDHRPLRDGDPRQEKIRGLLHPRRGYELAGQVHCIGTSSVKWRELMVFPVLWDGEVEPLDWESGAEETASEETAEATE
jgi:hypothetical protein